MKHSTIICMVAALLCGHASSAVESVVSPSAVKKALTPDLIIMEDDHFVKDDERLVVVVGENHASVKTQIQLAKLTSRFLDQNLVQAILVEGCSGPFCISRFIRDLVELPMSSAELEAFWRQQLEAGRVAGYEYVVLTRPGIEVLGVEDMGAKARYQVGLQTQAYREVLASYERAATALGSDFESLREKAEPGDAQRVRSTLDVFNAARSRFAPVPEEVAQKLAPLGPPQVEMMELQDRLLSLYQLLSCSTPGLDDYNDWIGEVQHLYQKHKSLMDKLTSSSPVLESDVSPGQERDLRQLGQLYEKISVFETDHQAEVEQLGKFGTRLSELSKQCDGIQENLEPFLKQVEAACTDLEDSFFIAANALQSLAAAAGCPRPKSMSFFREETEQQRKENPVKEKPLLADRDRAMVDGTVKFLQSAGKQRVLLIVGYAHLPGIIEQLAADNVSFISGKLAASDENIEPWEEAAWEFRKRANMPVFSAIKIQMKEPSLLQSGIWKKEQCARLEYFRRIYEPGSALKPIVSGLAGNGKIFEVAGSEDSVVVVGRLPLDLNADFGSHVSDQGSVPGRAGEFYRVFDRNVAESLVKELSDEIAGFAYLFRTASPDGGSPTRWLTTSAGKKSLHDFMAQPPSRAKYQVLLVEPDGVEESGLIVSPSQRELRGGGTAPPGGHPPWTSAFADPEDPGLPILLWTINARRAHENLVAIGKQEPSRMGDVTFCDEADLPNLSEKLQFTPSRGDHAQMVVLMAKNTEEFRASIRRASEARLLKGKQVGLITCGDAFADTAALCEDLLRAGVLMVWVNDRQITPQAAGRLYKEANSVAETLPAEQRKTIEQLMNHSLRNWRKADPDDPDHEAFRGSCSSVDARPWGSHLRFESPGPGTYPLGPTEATQGCLG